VTPSGKRASEGRMASAISSRLGALSAMVMGNPPPMFSTFNQHWMLSRNKTALAIAISR
jgi:hypothetical protein